MKKNYKVQVKDDKITGISIPVYFFRLKKNGIVFAECPALRIVTYARTLPKARVMFNEAYNIWQETVNDNHNVTEVLAHLGWVMESPTKIHAPSISSYNNIPIHLLGSTCLNLNLQGIR